MEFQRPSRRRGGKGRGKGKERKRGKETDLHTHKTKERLCFLNKKYDRRGIEGGRKREKCADTLKSRSSTSSL